MGTSQSSDGQLTISQVADRFRYEWTDGDGHPDIDEYVLLVPESDRQQMLVKLVEIEVGIRATETLFQIREYKRYGEEAFRVALDALTRASHNENI